MIKNVAVLIAMLCILVSTAAAQNYHPTDIGNTWVFESQDRTERATYTLETPDEDGSTEQFRTLQIVTEVLGTTSVNTNAFLIEIGQDGLKLHELDAGLGDLFGTVRMEFATPVIFLPAMPQLGETWEMRGETEVYLAGDVTVSNVNKIVAIENVDTPAGTFENCAKIRLDMKITAALGASRSTSYLWLAPDIGPVKFETAQDVVFELVSFTLVATENPYDVNADGVVNILDLTFVADRLGQDDPQADVNNDNTVNILDLVLIAQNFEN